MAKLYDYESFIISNYEKVSGSKLFIDINGKTFAYRGELDTGYFLEELVYSILKESKIDIDFNESPLQVVISFPDKIVLVSLKDTVEYEETIVYYTVEFKQEEIYGFLGELIFDDEAVVYIDYNESDDSFKVTRNIDEFHSEVLSSSIKITKVVTGFHKIVSQLMKIRGDILGVLILLTLPGLLYYGLSNTISTQYEKDLKKLEIQFKLLDAQHRQEEEALQKSGNKYREIEKTTDFFSDRDNAVISLNKIVPGNLIKEEEIDNSTNLDMSLDMPSLPKIDGTLSSPYVKKQEGLPELKPSDKTN